MPLAPLRSADRVVAGYATIAFGIGGIGGAIQRQWIFAVTGAIMAGAGFALLLHDHRRWRVARRIRSGRRSI